VHDLHPSPSAFDTRFLQSLNSRLGAWRQTLKSEIRRLVLTPCGGSRAAPAQ
jgi:hypothetical protein